MLHRTHSLNDVLGTEEDVTLLNLFNEIELTPQPVEQDSQANERTFEAWTRTAFTCLLMGMVFARFNMAYTSFQSNIVGVMFVLIGGLLWIYSAFRYYYVHSLIGRGYYEANRFGIILAAFCLTIATGSLIVFSVIEIFFFPPEKLKI